MLGLLLDRPRRTLLLLAAVVVLALAGLARLRVDFTPHDLYGGSDELARVSRRIAEVFGSRDNVVLILIQAPDVLEPTTLQYVHDVSRHLREQPYSARVDSITLVRMPRRMSPRQPAPTDGDPRALVADFLGAMSRGEVRVDSVIQGTGVEAAEAAELRAVLGDAPMLNGTLISQDRQLAAIAMALRPEIDRIGDTDAVVSDIDAWLAAYPPPAGVIVRVTGQPHANTDFARRIRADQRWLMPISLLVCAGVLWFTFGSLTGVLLPLAAVLISAGVLLGGMGWVGEPLNILNNITPLLVIVVGLSDSIHLLERYSVERRLDPDARRAVRRTLATLTIACFLTSFTDAIGFGSLWAAKTELLARFGLTMAVAVMIAYLVTVALVPAWLALRAPRLTADRRIAARTAARIAAVFVPSSRRARNLMLGIGALAAAASLLASSRARVDTSILGLFEPEDPIYQATVLAQDKLAGVSPLDVILESSQPRRFQTPELLAAIDSIQHWSEAQDGILRTSSYASFLHEAWAVLAGDPTRRRAGFADQAQVDAFDKLLKGNDPTIARTFVSDDGSKARITIELGDIGSRRIIELSDGLRDVIRREMAAFPDVTFALGGNAYINSYGTDALMQDLLGSFGGATIGVGLSLLLMTRNLAAIFSGVVASVLPQGLVVLYMVLRGIPFNAGTAMIFCISTGLAIDGAIHLLARVGEEGTHGGSRVEILRRAVESTAAGTLMNVFTLALGFSVLTLSEFLPLRQFGELSAVAALTSLLGTFVLMPNLLDLIGTFGGRPPAGDRDADHHLSV